MLKLPKNHSRLKSSLFNHLRNDFFPSIFVHHFLHNLPQNLTIFYPLILSRIHNKSQISHFHRLNPTTSPRPAQKWNTMLSLLIRETQRAPCDIASASPRLCEGWNRRAKHMAIYNRTQKKKDFNKIYLVFFSQSFFCIFFATSVLDEKYSLPAR